MKPWWWREKKEKIWMWMAWHLVPRPVAYWVFIRMAGNTDENPGERLTIDVLKQHQHWVS